MLATLGLINKNFWRGYMGPIFTYLIPLVLMLFLGRIMGPQYLVPSIFLISTLCVLLVFMPQSIFEFKNSIILKRIGSTPIKPVVFLLSIAIFNFILVVSSTALMFVLSFAVFSDSLQNIMIDKSNISGTSGLLLPEYMYMFLHANWGDFIYSFLLMLIMCIFFGLFIASIGRSTLFIQSVGISTILIVFFVGPIALPISMIGQVDVVRYIGYFIPFKYAIGLAVESFTSTMNGTLINISGSSIWDITAPYIVYSDFIDSTKPIIEVFNQTDKVLNLVMPWVFIMIFGYMTSVTFSWSNRGSIVFRWNAPWIILKSLFINKQIKIINQKQNIISDKNSPYILEVKDIDKTFKIKHDTIHASNHISFNVTRGRNLGLLGANGAGKTTLIEMMIGINKQDTGIFSYNFDFNNTFKESIGIQFQDSNYPFGIRCKDVINYFLKVYGIKMSKLELEQLLNKFGITSFYSRNCSSLSGGQQQRLNLLLSIIHKPKLLILDELSTGLDIKIRTEIKEFIKNYAIENNVTIIVISHDMNEVEYLCDDIIMMQTGQVVDITTKDKILQTNRDLEEYIRKYI